MENHKKWHDVKKERAIAHRARCVKIANLILADFLAAGVNAVVFGSLLEVDALFRDNSDIDICILNATDLDVEEIALKRSEGIKIDISFFSELKDAVKDSVLKNGVKNVG